MADSQVTLRWTGEGLRFEAPHKSNTNFHCDGDGVTAHSPVQALILSLGACTAADVVDIVTKMRVPLSGLDVFVEGDRNAEPPRYFKSVKIRFVAHGVQEQDREKVERAIALSHEKYCSVFHTLRSDLQFSTELELAR